MSYNKKAVLAANTAAIGLLLRLEKEQRTATEEEQKVLRAYQGFGGLKCILNRTDQPEDIRYWSVLSKSKCNKSFVFHRL